MRAFCMMPTSGLSFGWPKRSVNVWPRHGCLNKNVMLGLVEILEQIEDAPKRIL